MEYEKCELEEPAEGGEGRQLFLRAFRPATQELRERRCFALDRAGGVQGGGLGAHADEQKVYMAEQSENWTCHGSFRPAQPAMLPVPPVKGARRLARGRPGEGSQLLVFPVFHAEEVKAENEWHFQSALICYREGGSTLGRGWWRLS